MMAGMQSLTSKEMKAVLGGYCENYYGYYFCCPTSKSEFQRITDDCKQESTEKATAYIRFVYESCDWKNLN